MKTTISGNGDDTLYRRHRHPPLQYLDNVLEEDHRALGGQVKTKQGSREFHLARRTIQGCEAIDMIWKGQARWASGSDVRRQFQFINKVFDVSG